MYIHKVTDLRSGKVTKPVRIYAEQRDTSGRVVQKVRRMDLESHRIVSKDSGEGLEGIRTLKVATFVVLAILSIL